MIENTVISNEKEEIVRVVDNLNRIIIPKKLRELCDFAENIGIKIINDKIILDKNIGKEIKIDALGRINIPKSIRTQLGISDHDSMKISLAIVMSKSN